MHTLQEASQKNMPSKAWLPRGACDAGGPIAAVPEPPMVFHLLKLSYGVGLGPLTNISLMCILNVTWKHCSPVGLKCAGMFPEATLLCKAVGSAAVCHDLGAPYRVVCFKCQPYHWHANITTAFLWMLDAFPRGYGCNKLSHCFTKCGSWISWELTRNQITRLQTRPTELETLGTAPSVLWLHKPFGWF